MSEMATRTAKGPTTRRPQPSSEALDVVALIVEPNRARIIGFLGHGEHCVCDIGEALQLSPALVSHHLRALHQAGLLRVRRQGKWMFYSLDLEHLSELREIVTTLLTPADPGATDCLCSGCGGEDPPTNRTPEPAQRHLRGNRRRHSIET